MLKEPIEAFQEKKKKKQIQSMHLKGRLFWQLFSILKKPYTFLFIIYVENRAAVMLWVEMH